MGLEKLLRSRLVRQGYLPFSQPRYRGSMPFSPPRGHLVWAGSEIRPFVNGLVGLGISRRPRGISGTTNAVPTGKSLRVARPVLPLHMYEDRRLWHPEGAAAYPVSMVSKTPRIMDQSEIDPDVWRRIHKPLRSIPWTKMARESMHLAPATTVWGWDNPSKMIICLKRKIRREIMHAFGMSGKTGFKKPRFTQFSYVRCY